MDGNPQQDVHVTFPSPPSAAREANGQEMPIGAASMVKGDLVTSFAAYQPRTFAVKLPSIPKKIAVRSTPVTLNYDVAVATHEGKPAEGCFDCLLSDPTAHQGKALPAEMLPDSVDFGNIRFTLAPAGSGKPNAVSAHGQTVTLPDGNFTRLYLLAAAANSDQTETFRVGDQQTELTIQNWSGYIGQWDNRSWNTRQEPIKPRPGSPAAMPGAPPRFRTVLEFTGKITPGFIKRADVAWFSSHLHSPDGTFDPYNYSYLYAYPINLPPHAKTLTLPDNPRIRILAITVADERGQVEPAQPLYDTLSLITSVNIPTNTKRGT
jgi:alpha-mannosidase